MPKTVETIYFTSKLYRPAEILENENWTFLMLPQEASDRLPARSQVSVEGTINGNCFQATVDPDGNGGHWLKVSEALRQTARFGIRAETVTVPFCKISVEVEGNFGFKYFWSTDNCNGENSSGGQFCWGVRGSVLADCVFIRFRGYYNYNNCPMG